jgi:hypothetical protein
MKKSFISIVLISLILVGGSFATISSKKPANTSNTKIEKTVATPKKQNILVRKIKSAKWRVTHLFKKHKK